MKKQNDFFYGFKFHQQAFTRLRVELHDAAGIDDYQPLQASEVAVYVLYHHLCDDYGRILEGTHSFRRIAKEYDLNASTICMAHHSLVNRGLLNEALINGQAFIEITHYEAWNTPNSESPLLSDNNLNYFKIPFSFLYSLKDYIRARDVKGLVFNLSMINQSFRNDSIRSARQNEVLQDTMKLKARKTNRTLDKYLSRLRKVFNINVTPGVNNAVKYVYSFVADCFKEKQEAPSFTSIPQRISKDITHKFTYSGLTYNPKDMKDVFYAVKSELLDVIEPFFCNNVDRELLREIDSFYTLVFQETMGNLMNGKNIKSVGAYFRKLLRDNMKRYLAYEMQPTAFSSFLSYIQLWGIKMNISFEDVLALQSK